MIIVVCMYVVPLVGGSALSGRSTKSDLHYSSRSTMAWDSIDHLIRVSIADVHWTPGICPYMSRICTATSDPEDRHTVSARNRR